MQIMLAKSTSKYLIKKPERKKLAKATSSASDWQILKLLW